MKRKHTSYILGRIRGLTLLEVLVSVAIVAVVMTAIYGAYASNVESIHIARQSSQVSQPARIIIDRISKDIESAYIGSHLPQEKPILGMVGEDLEIDGRPADKLDFNSLAHLPLGKSGFQTDLCEIGYYVEEELERDTLILYRRDNGIVDEDLFTGGEAFALATSLFGFEVSFQGDLGEESEEWDTFEGDQKGMLPSLVTIKLTLKDDQGRERVFMTSIRPGLAGFEG